LPVSLTPVINLPQVLTTSNKFLTGVIDIGHKSLDTNISLNVQKKNSRWLWLGEEKNIRRKSRVRAPLSKKRNGVPVS
jgi:hypothetical protein